MNGVTAAVGAPSPGHGPAAVVTPSDSVPVSPAASVGPAASSGSEDTTVTVPRPTPHPAVRNGDPSPTPRPNLAAVPRSDGPSSDAPTAKLRVPVSPNGTGRYHGPIDEVARPGVTVGSPPPWNRVPGQELFETLERVPSRGRPAGGLLDDDDEPTAFLEAAAPAESDPDPDGKGGSRAGGWAAVRAVRGRPPRQAALQLKRLDPWSVLKLALVLAVVLFLIWLVAVGVIYGVLDGIGVWDRLNGTYADLVSGEAQAGSPLISAARVFTLAAIVGAINSLLFAVAVTVGAFVYNVSADLVGGIEVTLSERD